MLLTGVQKRLTDVRERLMDVRLRVTKERLRRIIEEISGKSAFWWSGDDHCACALVCEDFCKKGVARSAIDDVGAFHAAPQEINDTLKFRNHAARCCAFEYKRFCIIKGETREFCLRLACAQVDAVNVREQYQLLCLQLHGNLRS